MSRVLITGGTGSFGRAYAKRRLDRGDVVVVFSRDEQKHNAMMREHCYDVGNARFFVGDVRDVDRLRYAARDCDEIVHAAAMKHVSLCEYNPGEAVSTNVDGAKAVIDAAIACGVRRVVALSTDKAVEPVNLYGATKLTAEKLFVAANALSAGTQTTFTVTRYGNVMGSNGSAIPLWESQAAARKPITITDKRMTRFLQTMGDACDTVDIAIEAPAGEIVVPRVLSANMVDFVRAVWPKSETRLIGIRPGEKLHEKLLADCEIRRTVNSGTHFSVLPEFAFARSSAGGRPLVDQDMRYSSDMMLTSDVSAFYRAYNG